MLRIRFQDLFTLTFGLLYIVSPLRMCLAQDLPPCSGGMVTYTTFLGEYGDRMTVEDGQVTTAAETANAQASPQHTRWFTLNRLLDTKSGSRGVTVSIWSLTKHAPLVLSFINVTKGDVQVHWLNEKLLYGSVWWGRVLATDFIFDVEGKAFLYKEMASYSCFITQPTPH
jgi:hypothetical protein